MSSTIKCPKCGKDNRHRAKFCRYCGAELSLASGTPAQISAGASHSGGGIMSQLGGKTKRLAEGESADQRAPAPPSSSGVGSRSRASLTPLRRGRVLSHPGDSGRRYSVMTARALDHSIYYDAVDLSCSACRMRHNKVPGNGLCRNCQKPLPAVLIHERLSQSEELHPDAMVSQLIRLSGGQSSILSHRDIIQYREHVYAVVEHPGRWGVVVRGQQRETDEALAGTVQIGRALAYLHKHGVTYSAISDLGLESLVATHGGVAVELADLSLCARLPSGDAKAGRAQIERDIAFLGNLLFYLATGEQLKRSDIDAAPPALCPFIEQAMRGEYRSVQELLSDFSRLPSTPARSLKPSHGQATHPGQEHTRNEDAVITFTFDKEQDGRSVPLGFYLVADGMGGYDAGDVASRTVNQIVTEWMLDTKVLPDLRKATRRLAPESMPGDLLTEAIQEANEVLLRRARAKGGELGSTVTTALVIGGVVTIANVGDSRTYLLRDGQLEQITQDHSLVARLVDAGVIEAEDVRSHPQRNQIYRCLGHDEKVKVETFTQRLQPGDILVLCSDGLWEMVLNDEIQRIIESAHSPQQACDELVEAANRAGGEDNIAVIVVEME